MKEHRSRDHWQAGMIVQVEVSTRTVYCVNHPRRIQWKEPTLQGQQLQGPIAGQGSYSGMSLYVNIELNVSSQTTSLDHK